VRRNRVRIWLFAQVINLLCDTGLWSYIPHRYRMRIWRRYFPEGMA
jgi:hypothetical protein